MPTTEHEEKEVENTYGIIDKFLKNLVEKILLGDFNAVVGEGRKGSRKM